jgi:hypothetical protein
MSTQRTGAVRPAGAVTTARASATFRATQRPAAASLRMGKGIDFPAVSYCSFGLWIRLHRTAERSCQNAASSAGGHYLRLDARYLTVLSRVRWLSSRARRPRVLPCRVFHYPQLDGTDMRIGIVTTRWNSEVVGRSPRMSTQHVEAYSPVLWMCVFRAPTQFSPEPACRRRSWCSFMRSSAYADFG